MPRSRPKSTPKERIIPIQIEGDVQVSPDIIISSPSCSESSDQSSQKMKLNITTISEGSDEEVLEASVESEGDTATAESPLCNCCEKIILVLDCSERNEDTPFMESGGTATKPLDMLKELIELFVYMKNLFKHHEYALVFLNQENVQWKVKFTSNINQILHALQDAVPVEAEDVFDLNTLFDLILDEIKPPEVDKIEGTVSQPPYIVRTILLYGRSFIPSLRRTKDIENLLASPYFTFDVLMTHESCVGDNHCQKIFQALQNIDQKGSEYVFFVERDANLARKSMAKLLGHPLQRAPQNIADYTIKIKN